MSEPKSIDTLNRAIEHHHAGEIQEAINLYQEALKKNSKNARALFLLGTASLQAGQLKFGVKKLRRSLELNPSNLDAHNNLAFALWRLMRLDEALASCDKAISLKPDFADAHTNRGNILRDLKRLDEALTSYETAISLKPDDVEAHYNRGNALQDLHRPDEALTSYETAISLNPDFVEAHLNQGSALRELKRLDEALVCFDKVISLNPNFGEAYSNRSSVLKDLRRPDEALASCDKAIALNPDFAEAYLNRGGILKDLKRLDEALASCDKAISLNPDFAEAYLNRGNVLQDLKRPNDALASYETAISLKPDYAEVYYNRGNALQTLRRRDEALESYDRAIAFKANIDFMFGELLHIKMRLCKWDNFQDCLNELTDKINNEEKVSNPFPVLSLIDDPDIQRKASEIYVNQKFPQGNTPPVINSYQGHEKIRIGYFSADFRDHPVSYLIAELFEIHDRDQFEIYAFSFGSDTKDEMNIRIKKGVDHFYDVRAMSDKDIVVLSRSLELDIAVDLGGFTQDSRTGIFSEGVAPIQVNYLGYPGTMAAKYMDYIIADQTLIPEHYQKYYSEKVVYLPHSYQPNISKIKVSEASLTRHDAGLPNEGFVFSCFNSDYKITPYTFSSWMKILDAVEGSVLWLLETTSSTVDNLKKEAKKSGINEDRLIFAKRIPLFSEHLNRIQLADLFLDTLPYNAHTTTSDALRMGLPVMTHIGNSFTSRVAASLLNAVNLPELITTTPGEYKSLAIQLALDPEKLKTIKNKLIHNLPAAPLYDTPLYARNLESAYLTMYERCQRGLDPDHIFVKDI